MGYPAIFMIKILSRSGFSRIFLSIYAKRKIFFKNILTIYSYYYLCYVTDDHLYGNLNREMIN